MTNNKQCGICAACVPQINGGSGFNNCNEAHTAQLAEDRAMATNNKLTGELEAERIKDIAEGAPIVEGEAQAMAFALQECLKASPVAWTDEIELEDMALHGRASIFKSRRAMGKPDPASVIKLYAVPQIHTVTLPNGAEDLYSIANHIEGSKGWIAG